MFKDIYHQAVRTALERTGWVITHDPYPIRVLGFDLDVDLGAERILAAEREMDGKLEKVAIEIKSFLSPSFMRDFHQAVGQYTNYNVLLRKQEEERILYLAVPKDVYERRFEQPGVRFILEQTHIHVMVFDDENLTIDVWKK